VDGLGREELLVQHLSQLLGVLDGLHEDDNLVELKLVQEVHQLGDLFLVVQHHVILLQSVQSQLALVFDEHLSLVLHELAADQLDVTGQGGREHHHLLVVRGLCENFLDIASHA